MRFKADHDYHIHTHLSTCSNDPGQTCGHILDYAENNNFKSVCITDHFWDETIPGASKWYEPQNYEHIKKSLPLPEAENISFMFGAETDLDRFMTLGISKKVMDELDFVIIPTTHLHMKGFTIEKKEFDVKERAQIYIQRLKGLLNMELPFEKIGIAHLTCHLLASETPRAHLDVLSYISDSIYKDMFSDIAKKGAGFELNFPLANYEGSERDEVLRPYFIAAECGCKFYLGSDAHHPKDFEKAKINFENIIDALGLTEDQKFHIQKAY